MTGYANKAVMGKWQFEPLDLSTLTDFLDMVFGGNTNFSEESLSANVIRTINAVEQTVDISFSDTERAYLEGFVKDCLLKLEREYSQSCADSPVPDIIFFNILWVKHFYSY